MSRQEVLTTMRYHGVRGEILPGRMAVKAERYEDYFRLIDLFPQLTIVMPDLI